MKKNYFISAGFLLLTACSAKVSAPSGFLPPPSGGDDPQNAYSDQELSGTVFNKEWKGKMALVRTFGSSGSELSLEIYQEKAGDICKTSFTNSPSISVVIPANYEVKEYRLDISSGTPFVFSGATNELKNVIADSGSLKINAITDSGFTAQIVAKAVDHEGITSEVNGKIDVIDCRKQINFNVWDEFVGFGYLIEFNGKAVNNLSLQTAYNSRAFYDRSQRAYVRYLNLPLINYVSGSSTSEFSFGPLEGLGITKLIKDQNGKTLSYSYHGPITADGRDVTLNLDMTVVTSGKTVHVTYTLEVPKHINKVTNSFKYTR